jgi:hypothetical protein
MATEKTYKQLSTFISNCLNSVLSLCKILLRSKIGIRLPAAQGTRAIVLANGPSLKTSLTQHPEAFKNVALICVNTFSITPEYKTLQPKYYVMLDPFFWEQKNETTDKTFKALKDDTSWELNLLVPQTAKRQPVLLALSAANKNIRICAFNYTVFKGFPSLAHFLYRKNLAMPQSLNVTISALFLGINMGFKEIMLVGADHTWHENLHMSEDNVLHTKVTHFYENDVEIIYQPFHKASDKNNPTHKAHEFFDIWSRTFYGYQLIEQYAQTQNCRIWNASEVSFIDAFDRKKLGA